MFRHLGSDGLWVFAGLGDLTRAGDGAADLIRHILRHLVLCIVRDICQVSTQQQQCNAYASPCVLCVHQPVESNGSDIWLSCLSNLADCPLNQDVPQGM